MYRTTVRMGYIQRKSVRNCGCRWNSTATKIVLRKTRTII